MYFINQHILDLLKQSIQNVQLKIAKSQKRSTKAKISSQETSKNTTNLKEKKQKLRMFGFISPPRVAWTSSTSRPGLSDQIHLLQSLQGLAVGSFRGKIPSLLDPWFPPQKKRYHFAAFRNQHIYCLWDLKKDFLQEQKPGVFT